jgi:hypothetical protein
MFFPILSAQQRYNVVKDYDFENNDTVWAEFTSDSSGILVSRHIPRGYQSRYCGLTNTWYYAIPAVEGYCYLEQQLAKRTARDYKLDNNLRFYMKTYPEQSLNYYWDVVIESRKNRLIFLYDSYQVNLPHDDESTHVVNLGLPNPPTFQTWEPETLDFYKNWTAKFPETDTIEKLRLNSQRYNSGSIVQGQRVYWDNFIFESTRPDSDAAVIDINFSGNPKARVQNKGAAIVSFPVICKISKNGLHVYSDTAQVISLGIDSMTDINFKSYSDTGEMIIYTTLAGDQNPGNDTLTQILGVQEVVIKKALEFRVWPSPTRGMINFESCKSITVYDPVGRMIGSAKEGSGRLILLKSGIFFVRSGNEVKKIIRVD